MGWGRNLTAALLCGSLALCGSSGVFAQRASKKPAESSSWKFQRLVDKITDKVKCHLDSPSTALVISFQGGHTAYLISNDVLALRQGATLTVRVDKNAPIEMYVRNVAPQIAAVDTYIEDWLKQMATGKSLVVRLVSTSSGIQEEHSLKGFASAYNAYRECVAAALP